MLTISHNFVRRYFQSKDVGVPLTNYTHILPDMMPNDGIFIVDTAEMFAGLEGESGANTRGLERTARLLGIEVEYDHNAGNDAHVSYSLLFCCLFVLKTHLSFRSVFYHNNCHDFFLVMTLLRTVHLVGFRDHGIGSPDRCPTREEMA